MVYANQPRIKKKPRAGSDPTSGGGSELISLEEADEFEEDAQYGVSDAINKPVGEFNFEQRVVQGKSSVNLCAPVASSAVAYVSIV